MSHYVVTGACGYIGSVISKKLMQHGHTVTTVDLKATYPLYTHDHWANTCFSSELFLRHIIDKKIIDFGQHKIRYAVMNIYMSIKLLKHNIIGVNSL